MNPGLALLRKLRNTAQEAVAAPLQAQRATRPVFLETYAWVSRQHPALWRKIAALDLQLYELEQQNTSSAIYLETLHALQEVCRQADSVRDHSWSALLVKSSVLDGEEGWVVKTENEALAVRGDGRVVYYIEEILALQDKSPAEIREIHQAKRSYPGRVVQEAGSYNGTGQEEAVQEQGDMWRRSTDEASVEVSPSFETPPFEFVTTPVQFAQVLPRLLTAPVVGMDTETTGLDPLTARLRLVQIATPEWTVLVDLQTCPVQALTPLFHAQQSLIFHNAKFDLQFLTVAGLPWPRRVCDTMLMNQLLYAGSAEGALSHSGLASVVQRSLGVGLPKDEQRSRWEGELSREQLAYAARDAAVLLPLVAQLTEKVTAAGLTTVADIEHRCVPALAWLELSGLPLDADRWLARATKEEDRVRDFAEQLNALVGEEDIAQYLAGMCTVNWQSPAQVLEVLRGRGHQIASTDAATLSTLDDPLARLLLEYRDAVIRAGTFGREWLGKHQHPVTGRIHAGYLQIGASSGRMACTKPNVQNIPRSAEYRSCIRPEDGRCIVKADFSQIELRIAAVMANDQAMLTAFRNGQDLHAVTAAKVLHVPLDQVEKTHRQLAKSLNFGLLYGMGAPRLREYAASSYKVTLSQADAENHKRAFFRAYQGLSTWHRKTAARLEQKKTLETFTLVGRKHAGVKHFTTALNTPVQGSGADGLKIALARLFEHRHEVPEARLVACVHDEIVAECAVEEGAQTADWLQRHMTAAMQELVSDRVPIEVETTMGKDWAGTPVE